MNLVVEVEVKTPLKNAISCSSLPGEGDARIVKRRRGKRKERRCESIGVVSCRLGRARTRMGMGTNPRCSGEGVDLGSCCHASDDTSRED